MKLKTLKDIEKEHAQEQGDDIVTDLSILDWDTLLKQEAIKQIKDIRNAKPALERIWSKGEQPYIRFTDGTEKICEPDEADRLLKLSIYKSENVEIWIKDFFNITEKDLK